MRKPASFISGITVSQKIRKLILVVDEGERAAVEARMGEFRKL